MALEIDKGKALTALMDSENSEDNPSVRLNSVT